MDMFKYLIKRICKPKKFPSPICWNGVTKQYVMKLLEKLMVTYGYLQEFKYLLAAGSTGAAWSEYITNRFAGMQNLKIIFENRTDTTLPRIFSNMRGYYLKRTGILRTRACSTDKADDTLRYGFTYPGQHSGLQFQKLDQKYAESMKKAQLPTAPFVKTDSKNKLFSLIFDKTKDAAIVALLGAV